MISFNFDDVRGYLRETLSEAVLALKENRVRTFMSIIGVAVGIASVMTVGIVSQGGRQYVFSEIESYGLNTIWIYRDRDPKNPLDAAREGSGITNDDYELIHNSGCCPAISRFGAVVYPTDWQMVLRAGNLHARASVEGGDVEYLGINNDILESGRGLTEEDVRRRQPVAIIGESVRKSLFNNHPMPLGKPLRIGDMQFTVVGVMKEKRRDFLASLGATLGFDINNRVIIPFTAYQQLLGTQEIQTLQAEVKGKEQIKEGIAQVLAFLDKQHRGRYKYKSDSMLEWIETANRILYGISTIGLLAASVALFVGGIGIMNIMATTVMERTREIGIRMAIGARRSDILWQFLTESAVISLVGGIIGLVLGMVILVVLARWTGFPLQPDFLLIAIALVVAIGVGLASGYFPAKRASAMKPAEALRYD